MQVRLTNEASENLDQIRIYIAAESARAAARLRNEIIEATDSLGFMPNRGRLGIRSGTREIVVGRYIIVYRVFDTYVEVTQIRHHAKRR